MLFWGIIFAAGIANVIYVYVITKYNRKIKQIEDLRPYIKHLENTIKEYERITTRQNKYLENDNSNSV